MKEIRKGLIVCCLLGLLTIFVGCGKTSKTIEPQGTAYFTYFDTVSYVYSYAGDSEERFQDRSSNVSAILKEYHQLFDIYNEYSGINNLCTINRLAGGEPVQVDEKLIEFLVYAKDLYNKTDGEMNIMMGAVLSIWHDYRTEGIDNPSAARLPSDEELEAAMEHTDFSLLEIDEENMTVRLTDSESSIDVGALGKGYATERATEYLFDQEAYGYVLNIGGNIRIIGTKPDGSSWVTGIRDPENPDGEYAISLNLADTACVTSGDYERYYTVDGVRYHHIIDQDTLFPAEYFSSITVITEDSGLADALSTALFCMSYEDGMALLERLGNADAIWISRDGGIKYSPGLEDNVIK